jgi:xanthine dehydrogenase small subunit
MTQTLKPAAAAAPSSQPIRFYFRGEVVSVEGLPTTRTVLQHLREDRHCVGTKEGCAEGDCGACTVVIGERDASAPGGLALKTVNSCIQFLPTLHGKALFTVEDLKAINGGALHPVQQAMVDCHGSQCGFCTPGFVMSLFATYEQHQTADTRPSRQELADELSGNLCRCTGYRPILDAGEAMFDLAGAKPVTLDRAQVATQLAALETGDLAYQAPSIQGPADRSDSFWAPTSLDSFAARYAANPKARILSGSTDVGLWVTKQFRDVGDLLYIGRVEALTRIEVSEGSLHIGAGASLEAAWSALATHYPSVTEVWRRFAGKPVRYSGTMGGNVANGSPIGDSAPVLMAMGAVAVLQHGPAKADGSHERRLVLEDLYLDYMKNAMQPGEFIARLEVPLPVAGQQLRAYKISKRFDCDISAVCLGASVVLDAQGRVASVRTGVGGMAATVKRAARAEAALLGQAFDEVHIRAAMDALAADFKPLSDMRASADYRLQVTQNLLYRFWLETSGRSTAAGGASAPSIWAVEAEATP